MVNGYDNFISAYSSGADVDLSEFYELSEKNETLQA